MASSFQAFPPPLSVYPTTETDQPESNSYHSNGSYGTVFVVLGVIIVVSAIACVLGRLCSKRSKHSSDKPKSKNKNKNKHYQSHEQVSYKGQPHSSGRSKDRDIELGFGSKGAGADFEIGFDKKIPKGKVAPNGHGKGQRPMQNGTGQFGGHPMGHNQFSANQMLHKQQLPMMECPRGFQS